MRNLIEKIKSDLDSILELSNPLFLLIVLGCLSIVVIIVLYSINIGSSLNFVSGTWIGLAMDFSDGIFYRPLFSDEIGFGGTRYFPLFFSIHALLIKLFGMPIISGHIVSIFSGLLLLWCLFYNILANENKTNRNYCAINFIDFRIQYSIRSYCYPRRYSAGCT